MFKSVSVNVSFPEIEREILQFWEDRQVFQQSLKLRQGQPEYVFYDGPPFATGLPHYGHLLAGTIKDVVPRYQTMRGKYVARNFGWDCHGLPIEALAQEALGLAGAPAIKEFGIARFNEKCRSMVLTYVDEWRRTVTRMGRWVDFDNDYKTMDSSFMETIWWVFKQLWEQGRVYRAHRIMPYSWKLNTPLSNFEANRNYQEVQDPAVTVRMRLHRTPVELNTDGPVYIMIWTTTPWTLPANLAVCVGPDIEYLLVRERESGDAYLVARERLSVYFPDESGYEIRQSVRGGELSGAQYEPLLPYFADWPGAFLILADGFVSTAEGTGLVHMAPAYGEDDYRICRAEGIKLVDPLDDDARFTAATPDYAGLHCKEADPLIIKRLKSEGKLVHQATINHSYPCCERTDTPLIYRAIEAWYVKVEDLRERLLAANRQVGWMPEYVGEKRFGNWLAEAKDWNISRNRFWGSCIPVWVNQDDPADLICVGSVAELEELSGRQVTDLHKHIIDEIEIRRDGKVYRRTPEVLDCWFESGAMPYAQHHYPFANRERVESHFPADFIAEGLDQTRGWFYTLMVLSTALFDQPAFKNVIVNGLILAEDGRKMSKRLKNYPEPEKIMNLYGADAMRLTMLSSPVVRAEPLRFSEAAVRESMRSVILPLWNSYSFLVTYARVDNWRPPADRAENPPVQTANLLDRWILARLQSTVADLRLAMDNYELQTAALRFTGLIEDLTNWYIRRSRRRFWKSQNDQDKAEAYQTLYHVLLVFCRIAAPFIPFVTDAIWRNLRASKMAESVHLSDFPEPCHDFFDTALERRMANAMQAVSLGRFLRSQASLRVRQPLPAAILVSSIQETRGDFAAMREIIAEELNVKQVEIRADEESLVRLGAKANFRQLGPRLGRRMKEAAQVIGSLGSAAIQRIRNGEKIAISLADGEQIELGPDDILVQREEKSEIAVANQGDITVALDTRLDQTLILEGWARELVSRIQNLRKEKSLEVADKIRIVHDLPEQPRAAITKFHDYIATETLAVEIKPGDLKLEPGIEINGQLCRIAVTGVSGKVET